MQSMQSILLCISIALIAGLLSTRPAKRIGLPAVTAYLLTGLLLGPYFLGRLGLPGIGFHSMEDVSTLGIISDMALGFIAFTIGNEFRLDDLRHMGKQAITVGILQAVVTTVVVDVALIALHMLFPSTLSLPAAITLGAIAAATAPAATLIVVRQYHADGPLTRLLLMVVAIDDAVGLILFSVSFGVASALEQGGINIITVAVEPILEILLSFLLGIVAGFILDWSERYFHSRANRVSISVAFVLLTVALSMVEFDLGPIHCGFSLLLVCMMTGTVFCNVCKTSGALMTRLDRWTTPLSVLFFILSGADLDLAILRNPVALLIGGVYILSRSAGKIFGAYSSCAMTGCEKNVQKYLGITLLPQAGVALGMVLTASSLSDGKMIRNVVLFAVLVYELVGPTLTKNGLIAAGEIHEEDAAAPAESSGAESQKLS